MMIIGAGFGRTGTTSLKEALEHLGYHCYHMEEVVKNIQRGHAETWIGAIDGAKVDWDSLLDGYEATVDFPGCIFYRQLMDAFPDARVILSVRESEAWWKSFHALTRVAERIRYLTFLPFFRSFYRLYRKIGETTFGGTLNKSRCIEAFERHNAEVIQGVPKDRLLVYSVHEGWAPLCNFLDLPIPDVPFPHSNAGVGELKRKMRWVLRDQLFHRWRAPKFVLNDD